MSSAEPSAEEWKTIRISAIPYFKLVELSGLYTIILGSQPIALSTVAEWTITEYYDKKYKRLKEIISDPDKLEAVRKEIGGSLKRLFEVMTKPTFE